MKLLIPITLITFLASISLLSDEQSDREAYKRKLERIEKLEKMEKLCNLEKKEDTCLEKPLCIWIAYKKMCQFRGDIDYKIPKRPIPGRANDE